MFLVNHSLYLVSS